MKTLSVAKDYSLTPGPRYELEGQNSGQVFRDTLLVPLVRDAIVSNETIIIDLDGTAGYPPSFLEETFGGLIREHHFELNDLTRVLRIKSDENPRFIDKVNQYLNNAEEKRLKVA